MLSTLTPTSEQVDHAFRLSEIRAIPQLPTRQFWLHVDLTLTETLIALTLRISSENDFQVSFLTTSEALCKDVRTLFPRPKRLQILW
jgi:hypothetical protein